VWLVYLANTPVSLAPYRALFIKPRDAPPAGEALTVSFLGNTNLLISDGRTALLTDGFFTRPSLTSMVFGKIAPDRDIITRALARAGITRLAAVIVLHSHYDHAMDAPEVARLTGALLVGSGSTANIGRGAGLPEDRIKVAMSGRPMSFGRFRVTLINSRHFRFPSSGSDKQLKDDPVIAKPLSPPARVTDYKAGKSYSVVIAHPLGTLLIQGSAGYVPGALQKIRADVVFLGIGGLGAQTRDYQEAYFREVVEAVGARRIFPIHWDDLTRPIARPIRPPSRLLDRVFGFGFQAGMDFVVARAASLGINVALAPPWRRIVLFQASPTRRP
jgi:L-ascorbate metabolism protein UlaG (beta-lactamase superfamily)